VQLKFLPDEKDRDCVRILTLEGKEIAFHPDMQHNRNYRELRINNQKMAESTKTALRV